MRNSAITDFVISHYPPMYITAYDAVADMWLLFYLMQDIYGGYVYFGGDEVFIPLFESLESMILGYSCDARLRFFGFDRNEITSNALASMLIWYLGSIVTDLHFHIEGNVLRGYHFYFYAQYPSYFKSERGFRNVATGLYLASIEGHDIDTVMRLHINNNGDIFYRPVFFIDIFEQVYDFINSFVDAAANNPYEELIMGDILPALITFTYEDGFTSTYRFIHEDLYTTRCEIDTFASLEHIDGIPTVIVRSFGYGDTNRFSRAMRAELLISYARYLRDERLIIVDMRGNPGGDSSLPVRLIYELTGEICFPNFIGLSTLETLEWLTDMYSFYYNWAYLDDGYIMVNKGPREIIEREQKMIILIDRFTASAAEVFVDSSFNMTNTLVMGTPSAGNMAFGGAHNFVLPNTGIAFGFGRTVYIWPDDHFAEGAGIEPDIWVDGDALTAALALLRNAGFGYCADADY